MTETTTVIGTAGASGAGKTHFSSELFDRLQNTELANQVRLIHEDSYYKDQSHLEFEARCKTNYDHPDAFEHNLLIQHLKTFVLGQSIEIPLYDYSKHNRSTETKTIEPGSILIVEGILVLHDVQLREHLDIKVFLDVPLDLCLERRIQRDSESRGRDVESIVDQFETTVRPMYRQFVEPSGQFADVIVPYSKGNETALRMLVDHVVALHSHGIA